MKKFIYTLIIVLMLLPITTQALATNADDYEQLEVFVFTKKNCSECDEVKEYLDDYLKDKVNLKVTYLDSKDNKDTIKSLKKELDIKQNKYPLIVVGSNYLVGYDNEVKDNLNDTISAYQDNNVYCNLVNKIESDEDLTNCKLNNKDIIKQVEYKSNNIPWFIIGIITGFLLVFIFLKIIRKPKKVKVHV